MNPVKGVSLFCDFITLHQWHENPQPIFNSGFFVSFEATALGKSWQLDHETGEVMLKPVFDATQAIYTICYTCFTTGAGFQADLA